MKHTPTPWMTGCFEYNVRCSWIDEKGLEHRATVASAYHAHDVDAEANAAFIVEACNAYDTLKALGKHNEKVVEALQHVAKAQSATIARLQKWVSDLQAGMYINCVYCGHRYGPDDEVPCAMADVLKEHIKKCPSHPTSKLQKEKDALLEAVREADRIEPLRDELSECYARINGASRSTTAESITLSRLRAQEIREEIRAIRKNLRKAITLCEGEGE